LAKVDPYTQRFPTDVPLLGKNGIMNKQWVDWFGYDNLWKQQIFIKLGGGDDPIEDIENDSKLFPELSARVFDIEKRLGSGIEFTMDTEGFTMDTTEMTMDKTEQ